MGWHFSREICTAGLQGTVQMASLSLEAPRPSQCLSCFLLSFKSFIPSPLSRFCPQESLLAAHSHTAHFWHVWNKRSHQPPTEQTTPFLSAKAFLARITHWLLLGLQKAGGETLKDTLGFSFSLPTCQGCASQMLKHPLCHQLKCNLLHQGTAFQKITPEKKSC